MPPVFRLLSPSMPPRFAEPPLLRCLPCSVPPRGRLGGRRGLASSPGGCTAHGTDGTLKKCWGYWQHKKGCDALEGKLTGVANIASASRRRASRQRARESVGSVTMPLVGSVSWAAEGLHELDPIARQSRPPRGLSTVCGSNQVSKTRQASVREAVAYTQAYMPRADRAIMQR